MPLQEELAEKLGKVSGKRLSVILDELRRRSKRECVEAGLFL